MEEEGDTDAHTRQVEDTYKENTMDKVVDTWEKVHRGLVDTIVL